MAKTLCLMCKEVFDTKNSTEEQVNIGDESFCPACWERYRIRIMA